MGLPTLPSLGKPKNKDNNSIEKIVKVDDLPTLTNNHNSLNSSNKENVVDKNKQKLEDTTEAILKKIENSRRGTSQMAEIIDSKILFMAPDNFFEKYNEIVKDITSWIQNKMSESINESNIVQELKKDPTNIKNKESAFLAINKYFLNYESNPKMEDFNKSFNNLDKSIILALVTNEICGLGPLEPLFRDFTLKELACNGPYDVQVEKGGKMRKVPACKFRDEDHLKSLIDRLYNSVNKQITKATPIERARLHDNSRVFAVDVSVAPSGPSLNIRRHTDNWVSPDMLLNFESASQEMMEWLGAHINAEFNFIVAGGTATGKSLTLDTPIPTPQGFKLMGNLALNDSVFDTYGKETKITNIFDQEPRDVYEIKFKNSKSVYCDLEHNWYVSKKEEPDTFLTLTTKELIEKGFNNYIIPLSSSPVKFKIEKYSTKYNYILEKEIKEIINDLNNKLDLVKEYEFSPENIRISLINEISKNYPNINLNDYPIIKRIIRSLGYKDLNDFNYLEALSFEEIVDIQKTNRIEKMRCITVDSDSHTYLFGEDYLTTHNTTLLAALTGFYRNDARLLTVERNIELRPAPGKLWGTPMEVIPPNPGAQTLGIDMRTLVEATTQMRPDGIILGETTGPEAWDVTQALNSGHFGATTVHANGSTETIQRMIALISQADVIKGEALLQMLASSFDLIVVTTRFPEDGSRKITEICEIDTKVTTNEAGMPHLAVKPIWKFQADEFTTQGSKVRGVWKKVGEISKERRDKHNLDMITLKKWEELRKLYNV